MTPTPDNTEEASVINRESDKIHDLIKKESYRCNENSPDVLQLIDEIESRERAKDEEIAKLKEKLKPLLPENYVAVCSHIKHCIYRQDGGNECKHCDNL